MSSRFPGYCRQQQKLHPMCACDLRCLHSHRWFLLRQLQITILASLVHGVQLRRTYQRLLCALRKDLRGTWSFCDSDGDSLSKGADDEAGGKSLLDCAVTRTDKRADPTQVSSSHLISSSLCAPGRPIQQGTLCHLLIHSAFLFCPHTFSAVPSLGSIFPNYFLCPPSLAAFLSLVHFCIVSHPMQHLHPLDSAQ